MPLKLIETENEMEHLQGQIGGRAFDCEIQIQEGCPWISLRTGGNETDKTVAQVLGTVGPIVARIAGRMDKGGYDEEKGREYKAFLTDASNLLAGKAALPSSVVVYTNGWDRGTREEALSLLSYKYRLMAEPVDRRPQLSEADFMRIIKKYPLPPSISPSSPEAPEAPKKGAKKSAEYKKALAAWEKERGAWEDKFREFYRPYLAERQWEVAARLEEARANSKNADPTTCDLPEEVAERLYRVACGERCRTHFYYIRDRDTVREAVKDVRKGATWRRSPIARVDLNDLVRHWSVTLHSNGGLKQIRKYRAKGDPRPRTEEVYLIFTERVVTEVEADVEIAVDDKRSNEERLRHLQFGSAQSMVLFICPEGFFECSKAQQDQMWVDIVAVPTDCFPALFRTWVEQHSILHRLPIARRWEYKSLAAQKAAEVAQAKALGYPDHGQASFPLLSSPAQPKKKELPPRTNNKAKEGKAQSPAPAESDRPKADVSEVAAAAARAADTSN